MSAIPIPMKLAQNSFISFVILVIVILIIMHLISGAGGTFKA